MYGQIICRVPRALLPGLVAIVTILAGVWACSDVIAPNAGVAGPRADLSDAYASNQRAEFRSGFTPDRCIDVENASRVEGAAVQIWSCLGYDNQQFAWASDGTLRVYATDIRCITDPGGAAQNNDPLVIAPCDGRAGQRWVPTAGGTGIQLAGSDKCIDVPNADPRLGNHLQLWTCHGQSAQLWNVPGVTCGVSFTAAVTNDDALMAAYGIPATADTIHVCETWTGSDYINRETVVGRGYNAFVPDDTAQTVAYNAGQITGYAKDGGPVHDPVNAGPTAFDFMQADDATRQASFDGNPYYAVYAQDGGSCGDHVMCSVQTVPGSIAADRGVVRRDVALDTIKAASKFTKHGLKRAGVRALVDDAEDIGRSAAGQRQFRKHQGDADVVFSIDPATELLVEEEARTAHGTVKAKHTWKKGDRGAYVRERTEVESTEIVDGQTHTSHSSIGISDFKLNGGTVPLTISSAFPRTPR